MRYQNRQWFYVKRPDGRVGAKHYALRESELGATLWAGVQRGEMSGEAPEPGSIALIGLGLLGLAGMRRRGARTRRQLAP